MKFLADSFAFHSGGNYKITGTVSRLGVAGTFLVRLYDRASGQLLGETWSEGNGAYEFLNIPFIPNGFYTIAFDRANPLLNAAIADLITPSAM